MKTITYKQSGGACEKEFTANSFDEITEMSKTHGMDKHKESGNTE